MTQQYNIFLDDIRNPDYVSDQLNILTWETVRSYDDFCEVVQKRGVPSFVSYDHDLCLDAVREYLRATYKTKPFNYFTPMRKTGFHCADFLTKYIGPTRLHPPYHIHSQNHLGAENIKNIIENHNKNVYEFIKQKS